MFSRRQIMYLAKGLFWLSNLLRLKASFRFYFFNPEKVWNSPNSMHLACFNYIEKAPNELHLSWQQGSIIWSLITVWANLHTWFLFHGDNNLQLHDLSLFTYPTFEVTPLSFFLPWNIWWHLFTRTLEFGNSFNGNIKTSKASSEYFEPLVQDEICDFNTFEATASMLMMMNVDLKCWICSENWGCWGRRRPPRVTWKSAVTNKVEVLSLRPASYWSGPRRAARCCCNDFFLVEATEAEDDFLPASPANGKTRRKHDQFGKQPRHYWANAPRP